MISCKVGNTREVYPRCGSMLPDLPSPFPDLPSPFPDLPSSFSDFSSPFPYIQNRMLTLSSLPPYVYIFYDVTEGIPWGFPGM